jgi:hypothetical protein
MSLQSFQSANIQVQFETSDFASLLSQVTNRAQQILPLCETDLATMRRVWKIAEALDLSSCDVAII